MSDSGWPRDELRREREVELKMRERMVVLLRQSLDWVELNGMPAWTDTTSYPLDSRPSDKRFAPGDDVLVWAEREHKRYVYVGRIVAARVETSGDSEGARHQLRFERFERLRRPVLISDGGEDADPDVYDAGTGGFMNEFSYISEKAFDRVLARAERTVDG